jgi:hypothetical protein
MKRMRMLLEINRKHLPNAWDQTIANFRRVIGMASKFIA